VVTGGFDGRLLAWDPATPGDPVEMGRHGGPVRAVAVLPDGRMVSASGQYVLVWDTKRRAQSANIQLSSRTISVIATGPTSAMIAIAHGGELSLWST
jgi:hypothetical protein